MLFFYNTFKSAVVIFLIRNRALGIIGHYNPEHKMVEQKMALLICKVDLVTLLTDGIVVLPFTFERLPGGTLIIYLIATKYFYR